MRYTSSEDTYLIGSFPTGSTVTISLYNLATGSSETLTSNACAELGTTGIFRWSTGNISVRPLVKTEWLWDMTDGTSHQYGKLVLGGYPSDIISDLAEISADVDSGSDSTEQLVRQLGLIYKYLKSKLR